MNTVNFSLTVPKGISIKELNESFDEIRVTATDPNIMVLIMAVLNREANEIKLAIECTDPFHDHGDGCPSCDFPDGVPEDHFPPELRNK